MCVWIILNLFQIGKKSNQWMQSASCRLNQHVILWRPFFLFPFFFFFWGHLKIWRKIMAAFWIADLFFFWRSPYKGSKICPTSLCEVKDINHNQLKFWDYRQFVLINFIIPLTKVFWIHHWILIVVRSNLQLLIHFHLLLAGVLPELVHLMKNYPLLIDQ